MNVDGSAPFISSLPIKFVVAVGNSDAVKRALRVISGRFSIIIIMAKGKGGCILCTALILGVIKRILIKFVRLLHL